MINNIKASQLNFRIALILLAVLLGCPALHAAGPGDEVAIVYNSQVPESKDIAEHYAAVRHVPANQIFSISIRNAEDIRREEFREQIQKPLIKSLETAGLLNFGAQVIPATNDKPKRVAIKVTSAKIRYLVLCYGVPLKIAEDKNFHEAGESQQPEIRRNGAAVDSELACLPLMLDNFIFAGAHKNPAYACTNAGLINPLNGILMVARLDGPTPAIARSLVDKALEAETNGLWGRAYFDSRGITNGEYKLGDDWIRGAYEVTRRMGFETVLDNNGGTFPATFPLSQVALYAGWYDQNVSGPFAKPTVEFMPGALAYHLHSFSAATIRSRTEQWVGPFLDRGVTATFGCVDEPYLTGSPDVATFFARLTYYQFTFGEAAYAAQGVLSWQTTVVGDPLYRPFGRGVQQQLEDLEHRHSKLTEWAYLRLTNLKLLNGASMADVANLLEHLTNTTESPVLKEKLAELYSSLGKPSSSVAELQLALKLNPSHQQEKRILLTMAARLFELDRFQEASETYLTFVKDFPDYEDRSAIYRHLLELAHVLNKYGRWSAFLFVESCVDRD